MAIFSKALSLCRPSRKISTSATRNGLITNPMKEVEELVRKYYSVFINKVSVFINFKFNFSDLEFIRHLSEVFKLLLKQRLSHNNKI